MSTFGRKQEGKGETVQRLSESFIMLAPIAATWGIGITVSVTTIVLYPVMRGEYRAAVLIGLWIILSPVMSAVAFVVIVSLVKSLLSIVESDAKRERDSSGRFMKINKSGQKKPRYVVVVDENGDIPQ